MNLMKGQPETKHKECIKKLQPQILQHRRTIGRSPTKKKSKENVHR